MAQITVSRIDAESKTITITQGYIDLDINTLGSGTEMQQLPVNNQSSYSYSQSIYNGATCNKWDIRMRHTSKAEFSDNSVFLANLVCIYSGDVTFPANKGWIEIPLTTIPITAPLQYTKTIQLRFLL